MSEPATGPEAVTFSTADPRDVEAIVALVESAYRGEVSRRGWTTEADLVAGRRTDALAVGELLADGETSLLLARRDGELVGCCALRRCGPGRARVSMLAVSPDHQREGIGRAILDEAARRARKELGARSLDLAVLWPRAELIAWYERRGFDPTGRREPFPYGDERFGLPRRDDLHFVVLERDLGEEEET
jgi:ribosomal protein S18 acetylase RimI-like enzyme